MNRNLIIAIGAGHYQTAGGGNTGAVDPATGVQEFELVENYANILKHKFVALGYDARLSRPDRSMRIHERLQLVTKWRKTEDRKSEDPMPTIVYLSLHCNSFSNTRAAGAEVFVSTPGSKSEPLAAEIQEALVQHGFKDRGVKYERWYMLTADGWNAAGTYDMENIYAALVEFGFITNPADRARLTDDNTALQFCDSITNAVDRWIKEEFERWDIVEDDTSQSASSQ